MSIKQSLFSAFLLIFSLPLLAADWRPIDPALLALKQSRTDPNADAEALFRDVRIENSIQGANQNVTTTYIRIKIFNDRGREKYSDVKIEYSGQAHVSDVAGRTIHPDGTIIDLKKDAIFDKVESKKGGDKVKLISFALPSVEPGSIIEYRWAQNEGEHLYRYIPLDVQSEYPVDEVTFHIKPPTSDYVSLPMMRFQPFLCSPERGPNDNKGFTTLTVKNVPGYRDEPYSPPYRTMRAWILVYYEENDKVGKDKFWISYGKQQYGETKDRLKITGEIKQAANEVITSGKTDEEKVALLAAYCRKNIKNIFGADISAEERDAYKPNNNSGDTFKRKVWTPEDIDFVFVAMAQAAGFEAHHAKVADRRWFLFAPEMQMPYFLNNSDAAVKIGDKWRLYDVSDEWTPPGTLTWREQGVYALILDPKNPEWVQTTLLTSKDTKHERIGDLTLTEEGDLEGDIRELLWGNESINWRVSHARQNDAERQEWLRGELKDRYADFEVSNIKIVMSPDASKPVGVNYHLRVKGYAQRTGKRIFFHPGFFAAGQRAYFTDATRKNVIYFDYPWSDSDVVDIHLPSGFQLDHAEKPGPVEFPPVGRYLTDIKIDNKTNTLIYRRDLTFGGDQIPQFDPKNYAILKNIFDQIHTNDEHMITLKAADGAASTQQ